MRICVLVMTDGRDELLKKTIDSLNEQVYGRITHFVIHDDTGDDNHFESLRDIYPAWTIIGADNRLGFAGAIDNAWSVIAGLEAFDDVAYIFHLEDDFIFNRPVDLDAMASVMLHHPHLVQMALRRQPWNEAEKEAGGIVELWPDEYKDKDWAGYHWLEHRLFMTTNPALWPMEFCRHGWPVIPRSEETYSKQIFENADVWAAYWGERGNVPWVHHIGEERAGVGY